ncbi:hypothetical protein OPV22_028960 [Ensete ventricosum]|uniref:Uncharacterized protein n=1 Tax=Ensete ventricosum TaxID=4639 RepID=A0AAV8Q7W3_ENSVE|nr:hypothetical protein OPV22_028929 [Ensete ventricosum]KAJ8466408.1 hypothetical protein OPV22_028960 [Ensete ventricosum]
MEDFIPFDAHLRKFCCFGLVKLRKREQGSDCACCGMDKYGGNQGSKQMTGVPLAGIETEGRCDGFRRTHQLRWRGSTRGQGFHYPRPRALREKENESNKVVQELLGWERHSPADLSSALATTGQWQGRRSSHGHSSSQALLPPSRTNPFLLSFYC